MTPKQELFCLEYLKDLNATAAYKRAGYRCKTDTVARVEASKLLANPNIAKRIQKAMDERAAETMVDANYVLTTIVNTIERCKQATPVLDRKGDLVMVSTPAGDIAPAYTFEAQAVLKGAELLGKHLKLFTDKIEHGGELSFTITTGVPKKDD